MNFIEKGKLWILLIFAMYGMMSGRIIGQNLATTSIHQQ